RHSDWSRPRLPEPSCSPEDLPLAPQRNRAPCPSPFLRPPSTKTTPPPQKKGCSTNTKNDCSNAWNQRGQNISIRLYLLTHTVNPDEFLCRIKPELCHQIIPISLKKGQKEGKRVIRNVPFPRQNQRVQAPKRRTGSRYGNKSNR